ncbi:MAG: 16S rRNA (cytosine(1402)-N(4))-methyltransferase, partial [Deltaproteobacteria bacterium]|nr:16S rRNA (cytosine(1402)-N(4))-methyltransferase [Deltaproteobacteria bacterium]
MHQPVLKEEVIAWFQGAGHHRRFIDVTLGGGGHAEAILSAFPASRLMGVDRDRDILERTRPR